MESQKALTNNILSNQAVAQEVILLCQVLTTFLLTPPTVEWLEAIVANMRGDCSTADEDASGSLAKFAEFATETASGIDEDTFTKVSVDRTFLIGGTTKQGPRPPYGSLYLNRASDAGESMVAIKEAYRAAGLKIADEAHEASDYLGVELVFLSEMISRVIAAKTAEDADENYRRIAAFFEKDLAPLAEGFIADAMPAARTSFCQGMLLMLGECMSECETLFPSAGTNA